MDHKQTSPDAIGARILRLRKHNGWSQAKLAKKANVSRSDVSLWESGRMRPSPEKAIRVCDVLNIELNYLLRGTTHYLRHEVALLIAEIERLDGEET